MTTIPTRTDADRADQLAPADPADRGLDLDTAASSPLAERVRDAFDAADITDRIDQSWITPTPDDDYPLAY
ncbi:hypothetical protein [Nocardia aurea]|uniref:Uncharacterized protein n=1 Tax=Nocardia aurea TaxID=2144174 RepID=A0ABV3G1J9_9NOCA